MRPSARLLQAQVRERADVLGPERQVPHAVRAGLAVQADVDGRQVGRVGAEHLEGAGRHVLDAVDLRELAGEPVQQLQASPDDDRRGGLDGDVDDADDAGGPGRARPSRRS